MLKDTGLPAIIVWEDVGCGPAAPGGGPGLALKFGSAIPVHEKP